MCKHFVHVRSLNPYNISAAHVPCGECAECRKKMQNDWTTRLKCELEYYHFKRKFNIGFITLTYNDRHLPHIPRRFFKKGEYRRIPCFSYIDIKRFTDGIRNYLFRVHGLTDGYRFFLSSEYGEKKHRPHYHAVLLFHPSISHELMYKVCSDLWCGTHLVIPENKIKKIPRRHYGIISPFEEDEDGKGGFIPKDNYKVGAYCAKYVCKDIEFQETIGDSFDHLTKRQSNRLRWFRPFHKQSRSFGSCIFNDKSGEQKLKYLLGGIPFVGSRALAPLPRYLKEKLLFTEMKRYNLRAHREETIRKYSKFFMEYREQVFNYKVDCMASKLQQLATPEFWLNHKCRDGKAHDLSWFVNEAIKHLGLDNLAVFSVVHYGLRWSRCHVGMPWSDFYLSRFDPIADWTDYPLIDHRTYAVFTRTLNQICGDEGFLDVPKRSKLDKVLSQIRALHQK